MQLYTFCIFSLLFIVGALNALLNVILFFYLDYYGKYDYKFNSRDQYHRVEITLKVFFVWFLLYIYLSSAYRYSNLYLYYYSILMYRLVVTVFDVSVFKILNTNRIRITLNLQCTSFYAGNLKIMENYIVFSSILFSILYMLKHL